MKKPLGKTLKKHKKVIGKASKAKGRSEEVEAEALHHDDQIESLSLQQDQASGNNLPQMENFETPEQVKQRIAKNMLQKLNAKKGKSDKDDFFIIDDNNMDEGLNHKEPAADDTYHEQVAEQFKQDHVLTPKLLNLVEKAEQAL